MTWGKKDPRAPVPGKKKPVLVWKDGEQDKHKFAVEQKATLPYHIDIIEPTPRMSKLLVDGPGAPFVMKVSMRQLDNEKRTAPILWADEFAWEGHQQFPKGTIAVYLGQVRCAERKDMWVNGTYTTTEISVWRHIFLVGQSRWVIADVNQLDPL